MHKLWQAEAVLHMDGGDGSDVAATAQLSAALAAKNAADILPLLPRLSPEDVRAEIFVGEAADTVRIRVSLTSEKGGEDAAMMAAMAAGLTVARMKSGHLEDVRPLNAEDADPTASPVPEEGSGRAAGPYARKPASAGPRPRRRVLAKPSTLMGEVAAPAPKSVGNRAQRDSFRNFMVENHLRASEWARNAGVPPATIYAYLTGSSGMIAGDVAEKLARAAHVSVEDLFRGS